MDDKELKHFVEILGSFDNAMLVTQRENELRSRPMVIADSTADGRVWFVTSVDSAKLEELTEYPHVNVAMQAESKFLSISGTVRATRDRQKVDEIWRDTYEDWFEEGRNDPELVLLEIVPTYVEYWDRSGVKGLKFMFATAANTPAHEAAEGEGMHGKLDFPKNEGEAPRSDASR